LKIKTHINRNSLLYFIHYSKNIIYDIILIFLLIFKKNLNTSDFKFVLISDSSHFKSSINLINSIYKFEKKPQIVFYDIGFLSEELQFLKDRYKLKIVKFEFNNYPSFISIRDSFNKLGSYAWKPVVLWNEYCLDKKNIIYLDAGCLLTKELKLLKFVLRKVGYFSPESSNKVIDWTHEQTLKNLNVDSTLYNKRNISSGLLGFANNNLKVKELLKSWYENSIIEENIAPKGSSRLNHRQDQAILTILTHQKYNHLLLPRTHKMFGLLKHQDVD